MRICFHGAESTGKSQLVRKLAAELGCAKVDEYGRTYAETIGTEFTLPDLTAIAAKQNRLMRDACELQPELVLLDTDPLMTAVWAEMLYGVAPRVLFGYEKADLYLLFEADVPFVADGTRFFGGDLERKLFARIAETVLLRAGVPYVRISGTWAEREAKARNAIEQQLALAHAC